MASEIKPKELRARMTAGDKLLVLDVRQQWEHDLARIEGSKLIPMNELPQRSGELKLEPGQQLVTYCHHGMRSMKSALLLEQSGFPPTLSLAGGIDAWSLEIDPKVPRY